jgi:BirA family biotin operon repressor/biotin-[acetyl-CoA-carboxylase] ligase
LLEENVALLRDYPHDGFAAALDEYQAADTLLGRPVRVLGGTGMPLGSGIARGVDADGALLVEQDGQVRRIIAGEISVRPDEES